MPAGIVTPDDLETIAKIGRKYKIPMLKITSGQRFALIGIEPEDVPMVFRELGPLAQPESAPLRQVCAGMPWHRYVPVRKPGLDRPGKNS